MQAQVYRRRNQAPGFGLQEDIKAISECLDPKPIPTPSEDPEQVKSTSDTITLDSFTSQDAYELGHLLHARLHPIARWQGKPTLVSISLANGQVLFQCAVGSGTSPDNERWVARKRSTVLRWGCSTWLMHCKYGGDEDMFRAKFGMSPDEAAGYAIHGGGFPIRVRGVEGVVAVVVVSGLKQHEDHGVIVETLMEHWEPVST
ncbi:hypothetical protein PspLS_09645 [Pyricularia sp. CBS 133598]|nr:hypothetical protein PspLS_09645 [Pyricularia sp. CBS 133598]